LKAVDGVDLDIVRGEVFGWFDARRVRRYPW
jgi:hypothetical protein